MCLIAFAWKSHPDYSLIVVANRDSCCGNCPSQLLGSDPQQRGSDAAHTPIRTVG